MESTPNPGFPRETSTHAWEMGPNPVPNKGVISRVRIVNSDEKFFYRVSLLFYEPLNVEKVRLGVLQTTKGIRKDLPETEIEKLNRVAENEITFDVKKRDLYAGDLFQFYSASFVDSPLFPLKEILAMIDECGIFDSACICGSYSKNDLPEKTQS